jgi:hypothetical protein
MSRKGIIQPAIKSLKLNGYWIFDLNKHKYSVISSALQTVKRDNPGTDYELNKNNVQQTLMVTRTA